MNEQLRNAIGKALSEGRKDIYNYFSDMWWSMRRFFTTSLGWQGLLMCVMVAILLGWILPSCAHR